MQRTDFSRRWSFYKDDDPAMKKEIDLPHDAQISEIRSPELPMDSGYFPGGKYIYEKDYYFPGKLEGKLVVLEFDGVYMNAEILVNGVRAGFQPYGYTNFLVPISTHLLSGQSNEIKVIADNSQFPNSRWYTGSGIYRKVYMHIGERQHIQPYGVRINTISYNPARIALSVDVTDMADCVLKTEIRDGSSLAATVYGENAEVEIPEANLWDAENPCLYTAHTQLIRKDEIIDETTEVFGIRKLEWEPGTGLRINGKELLLRGGCIHHDNGLLGAAAYPESEERKIIKLKEAGFNAVRSSHNMCSNAMLEACDKYGMYMMDEFADMWLQHKHKHDYASQFKEWYEKDLASIVRKDYNHPSVIMYSIGNEVGETATAEGVAYAEKMTALVHKLDDSRPVTCGINLLLNGLTAMGKGLYQDDGMVLEKNKKEEGKKKTSGSTFVNSIMSRMGGILNFVGRLKKFDEATREVFKVLDIAGYNYGSGRYKVDPKKYPDRITVGSETFPPTLYKNWQAVKKYPNLIGDFIWTAWDYLGEAGLGVVGYGKESGLLKDYPTLLAGCGIIDITGELRPEVYWNRIIWGLQMSPYLAVEPLTHSGEKVNFGMWRNSDSRHSWAWAGCEGRKTTVTVYSAGNKVELFLNDSLIGKRRVKSCKAVFRNVPYIPGELKAVAWDSNGRCIGEDILKSAQNELGLQIKPEQETFKNDQLLYVNIYKTDKHGIREFGKDSGINVTVAGGTLIAFGSADPAPTDNYQSSQCMMYNGKAQLIVKPDQDTDRLEIEAETEEGERVETKYQFK